MDLKLNQLLVYTYLDTKSHNSVFFFLLKTFETLSEQWYSFIVEHILKQIHNFVLDPYLNIKY